MSAPLPEPGNPWVGGLLGVVGTVLGHVLVLAIANAVATPVRPGEHGGLELLIVVFNPMCTLVAWAPIVALLLRRRRGLLRGFLTAVGLVILLNTACWGLVAVNG